MIDNNGNVIGIVTAMLHQLNTLKATGVLPQGVNYAVKSDYIVPLLPTNLELDMACEDVEPSKEIGMMVEQVEDSIVLVIAK